MVAEITKNTGPTTTDHDVGAEASSLPKAVDRKGRAPSTWALKSWKERNLWETICALDICPAEVYFEKPEGFDRGPPPRHPLWRENGFILTVGALPIYAQLAAYKLFPGTTWNPWAAFALYHVCFMIFAATNLHRLHYWMTQYGTFDENVRGRDLVSDKKKDKLGSSILIYVILRTAAPFLLAYDRNELPHFTYWSPIKVAGWLVALDFFFYCYHRACHEVPWLWHIHRAHHGTKHPTPVLSILADDYQEIIEVILVPLCATMVVQLKFHEAWIAIVYLLYVEMLGHSGIRAHWPHPILTPVLAPFKAELAVEDHDLHHRYGRGGRNYGKQTRIFDRLFGTVAEREDTKGM